MREKSKALLTAAAFLFTKGNNSAKGLSEAVGISESRIYKWVKLPEWDKALDALKFDGDRSLKRQPRRDVLRDAGELVAEAKAVYDTATTDGKTATQAVTTVCETLNLDRRRVNGWRDRFNWDDTQE